jgi:hypothetical protein
MEYNIASSSCAIVAISAVAIAKPANVSQLAKVRFVIGAWHVVRVARLHFSFVLRRYPCHVLNDFGSN